MPASNSEARKRHEAREAPPKTPALDAWYKAHTGDYAPRPTIHLWYPTEAPHALLHTIDRGCHLEPVLRDPERPNIDVELGGGIVIGGPLDEIEAFFDAARESVRFARWQADTIARRMADEEATGG